MKEDRYKREVSVLFLFSKVYSFGRICYDTHETVEKEAKEHEDK